MRANTERTAGASAFTMAALMLAVFTVSVGFGVVLALLPYLIERASGQADFRRSRYRNRPAITSAPE